MARRMTVAFPLRHFSNPRNKYKFSEHWLTAAASQSKEVGPGARPS